jgi:DNA-binding IclR family transcriptional regulator
VKKDPANSLYSPTLKLWEMGSLLVRDVDLVSVAGPRLRRLMDETHESVQLAVFDAGFVVYVDKVDSAQPLKAMTSIGSRVPATVTSTGKAMLAWLPSESLDVAFAHTKRYTPLTLTRRKDIERDLEETRGRGYSINRGEFRVGVCGIGVPVRDRTGGVIAAIGVWGAEKNIIGARRDELAHMAVIAARDVSRDLGFIEAQAQAPTKREPAEALA